MNVDPAPCGRMARIARATGGGLPWRHPAPPRTSDAARRREGVTSWTDDASTTSPRRWRREPPAGASCAGWPPPSAARCWPGAVGRPRPKTASRTGAPARPRGRTPVVRAFATKRATRGAASVAAVPAARIRTARPSTRIPASAASAPTALASSSKSTVQQTSSAAPGAAGRPAARRRRSKARRRPTSRRPGNGPAACPWRRGPYACCTGFCDDSRDPRRDAGRCGTCTKNADCAVDDPDPCVRGECVDGCCGVFIYECFPGFRCCDGPEICCEIPG